MVIGIDTIRFHKSFHPKIVKELIRPKLGRDSKGNLWFYGCLTFINKADSNRFSFQVSFSKLVNGSNLIPATPEIISKGIEMFEDMAKLNVRDVAISRLDTAMNMETDRDVKDYFAIMRKHRGYEICDRFDGSQYLNNNCGKKSLALYNKRKEMLSKGHDVQDMPNTMRIEFRVKRDVERQLGIDMDMPSLTLMSLAQPYGYVAAIKTFENNVARLLDLRHCKKAVASEMGLYYKALEQLSCKHPKEMETILKSLMQDAKNVDAMKLFDKRRIEQLRMEVYNNMRVLCDGVYAKHPLPKLNTINKKEILGAMENRRRRARQSIKLERVYS